MKQGVNIAVLASGKGSNAEQICHYFMLHPNIHVRLIVSNKPEAGVLKVADHYTVEKVVIPNSRLEADLLPVLMSADIDFVVLAGFLRVIPADVVKTYTGKMVNIHPALLPAYGGKGMYGRLVHQAVIDAGETKSGITIHFVTEEYDKGDIIFQQSCEIEPSDTPDRLAEKIHQLEHRHYPVVIENLIRNTYL